MKKADHSRREKITPKQYFQFALVMIIIIGSFFLFIRHLELKRIEKLNDINRDYSLTKGIITEIYYATGRKVSVKFKINNKIIEGSGSAKKLNSEKVGDSIVVKYSNKTPENFITELSSEY